MKQHIQQDSTEDLIAYPPSGVPSSATVRIATPSTGMPAAADAQAATVDVVSASTSASASAGDESLSFATDPACTTGRLYLVTDSITGATFRVKCVKTGATLYLAEPIPMSIGIASTVEGIAVTHALTATETQDAGDGNVIVNATVEGRALEWQTSFHVVARQVAYTLDASKLGQLEPDIKRYRPTGDNDWSETIQAAWDKYVSPDLASRGFRSERVVSWDAIAPWHAAACMVHVIANNPSADGDDKDRAMAMMRMHAVNVLDGSTDWWYDGTDTAGPDTEPEDVRPMSTRITR